MKKLLCLMLCVLVVNTLFTACSPKEPRALVTEDGRKIVRVLTESALESHVKAIVNNSKEELADTHVEIEVLPFEPEEREGALARIRAEIMAGEGPDVFVMTTGTQLLSYDGKNILGAEDALITDVMASLQLDIFLPLDEYLSGEYLKFDEHFEVLMNSGRTEEGLEVLPFTYDYLLYPMDKTKIDGDYTDFSTMESLKKCTDERLKNYLGLQCSEWGKRYFTDIVDYENGSLKLSLEEFTEIALELASISGWYTKSYETLEDFPTDMLFYFDYYWMREWNEDFDRFLPVVMPNMDGGLTVDVTSYIAVNRNCVNKEQAVRFAELFYYNRSPRVEGRNEFLGMDTQKTPYVTLEGTPVEKYLLENVEKITHVRYSARMDETISVMINSLDFAEESEKAEIIKSAYRKLQMMAAE